MEIELVKKTKNGTVSFLVNGEPAADKRTMYVISRRLTGTSGENLYGIFSLDEHEITFTFGDHRKRFPAMPETRYSSIDDPIEKIAECIRQRVRTVRDWVRSIGDREESATITFDDDAV